MQLEMMLGRRHEGTPSDEERENHEEQRHLAGHEEACSAQNARAEEHTDLVGGAARYTPRW